MNAKKKSHIIYKPVSDKPVSDNSGVKTINSVRSAPKLVDVSAKDRKQAAARKSQKRYLINKINHINFKEGTILLNFKHEKYKRTISRYVKPQPCQGDRLDCFWAETTGLHPILKSYKFENFLIDDGKNLLLVKPELKSINKTGLSFKIPDTYREVKNRRIKRHSCKDINVKLLQNSVLYNGSLTDFNAVSFRIDISTNDLQAIQWINCESKVNVIFDKKGEVFYSGECRILKEIKNKNKRSYILEPINYQIQRFKSIEYRSKRQKLLPSPDIVFIHPFTDKTIDLKIVDLSGSGFSVEEDDDNTVLLPGMIIPDLEISFASNIGIKCKAQVIYRNIENKSEKRGLVKCGVAILDIKLEDHMNLLAILNKVEDSDLYICNKVDLDDLWDFFFETGLISSKKYENLQAQKEQLKNTYEKLYTNHPDFARHFIYQDKGVILAHAAMLRLYEKTWLMHHHASRLSSIKSRFSLLAKVARFTCDSYRLSSMHMDYLVSYYQATNKFSSLVFNGVAKSINDPKGCSLDTFAGLHYRRTVEDELNMQPPWRLTKTLPEDLEELASYYQGESGGLMIQALDLEPGAIDQVNLTREYQKMGFTSIRHVLSLKKYDSLRAIIVLNISDVGINLEDLTNCIKIIVIDPDDLPKNTLYLTLSLLLKKIARNEMSVLIYPSEYAKDHFIQYEKLLNLWILNTQYSDKYYKHLQNLVEKTEM
jgi:hypothetical protein